MKNPVFRRIYLVYVGLVFVFVLVLLALLWRNMVIFQTKYDDEQRMEETLLNVKRAPEKVFLSYARNLCATDFARAWLKDNPDAPESTASVAAYFENLMEEKGAPSYYKSKLGTSEKPAFEICFGDELVCVCYLSGSGTKWAVSDMSAYADGENTFKTIIPNSYRVMCNGKELTEGYITKSDIVMFPYDRERETYDDYLVNEVLWNEYRVDGLLSNAVIEIIDKDGNKIEDKPSSDDDEEIYRVYADEEDSKKLTEAALGFLESYLVYYTYGKNMIDDHIAAAQEYCFSGSPADKALINAYEDSVSWAYGHTDLRNEILSVGRPVMWADNCCSIDIKYHAYAKRGGEELDYSRRDEIIRVVMLDKGKGYKVFAFDVSAAGEYLDQ
ncbi:MAG: hypothetical protein K5669_08630 [Lachnospiraceae bacterium]|nr:hypothetical protein [Lachnospiraceae bacterium]